MRKAFFAYAKTKTQISFAVTAKLNSAFVIAIRMVHCLYYLNPKFKPLAILCGCKVRFVSGLIVNPEDRFSHIEAHLRTSDLASVLPSTYTRQTRDYQVPLTILLHSSDFVIILRGTSIIMP